MDKSRFDSSRRRFLGSISVLAGGVLAGYSPPSLPTTTEDEVSRHRTLDLLDQYHAFDLHSHPGQFFMRGVPALEDRYPGDKAVAKTVSEMLCGRLSGAFFALVADLKILERGPSGLQASRTFEEGEAWSDYQRQITELKNLLEALPAELALRTADIEALQDPGYVAAFAAVEGGDCLEGRPERLERMYSDGVRSLQPVHYTPNELGDLQTEPPTHNGLSEVGREIVREMNRLGMVIDVAHASFATVRDVVDVSDDPIILSHGQLKWDGNQHPRFLSADHARLVAANGGVIGMWPFNETLEGFVDSTLRMVEAVGIDHVGLGTDMDAINPPFDMYHQLPDWIEALLAEGLTEAEVGKLVSGNAVRVLQQALK